jgi:hypothetical protein
LHPVLLSEVLTFVSKPAKVEITAKSQMIEEAELPKGEETRKGGCLATA